MEKDLGSGEGVGMAGTLVTPCFGHFPISSSTLEVLQKCVDVALEGKG